MPAEAHGLLRVQAHAFNAKDLDTAVGHYTAAARFLRDGEWIGEGREAVRQGLEQEFAAGVVGRLAELDGESVLVAYTGDEGHEEPSGVLRFRARGAWLTECSVDHSPSTLQQVRRPQA